MSSVTLEALYDINDKISRGETVSEEEFKIVLSGAAGESDKKVVAVQIIARHIENFPTLKDEAISAVVQLANSDDMKVKKNTINNLPKLVEVAKRPIANCLFAQLADKDESIVSLCTSFIERYLRQDAEFREILFESITDHEPECQVKLFNLVKDTVKFDEESVSHLINLLEAAFKSCVVEGLRLYGRNKRVLSEEQAHALLDSLLQRLVNSLNTNFEAVVTEMLPQLFQFTKVMGDYGTTKLMEIVSEKVMPEWSKLKSGALMRIIQKFYDSAAFIKGDGVLSQIYTVFLSFPNELIPDTIVNISVFECTLWAFIKHATAYPRTASELIGKVLVYTGQPDETEGLSPNSAQYKEFETRINLIMEATKDFLDDVEHEIKDLLLEPDSQDKKERMKRAKLKKKTGKNCKILASLLLSATPLLGKLPSSPSWHKTFEKNNKQTKKHN